MAANGFLFSLCCFLEYVSSIKLDSTPPLSLSNVIAEMRSLAKPEADSNPPSEYTLWEFLAFENFSVHPVNALVTLSMKDTSSLSTSYPLEEYTSSSTGMVTEDVSVKYDPISLNRVFGCIIMPSPEELAP